MVYYVICVFPHNQYAFVASIIGHKVSVFIVQNSL